MVARRLDQVMVERGFAGSRSRAQALIKAGKVRIDGQTAHKPAQKIITGVTVDLAGLDHPWVSRGGMKLAAALGHFGLDPAGAVCLDIGASTGGFTDVLIQGGAARVHAVDVGHGQLASALAADPRVVNHEAVNARYLEAARIGEAIDLLVCDASFIGLRTVLPAALGLCRAGAAVVALIKPQFETGPGRVGKGGFVKDPAIHAAVCATIVDWLGAQEGWRVIGVMQSPITGPDGNVEFLICGQKK